MMNVLPAALGLGFVLGPDAADSLFISCTLLAAAVVTAVVGVVTPGVRERRIQAAKQSDNDGTPRLFTLSLGEETVALDSGRPWVHVDRYKWVTRGLIEEPQSFHVLRDGTVEINGEKIRLSDPDGIEKLEFEINKHHASVLSHKSPPASPTAPATAAQTHPQRPDQVRFKVRLDRLSHLMIECFHGTERMETGLRGLSTLIQNGLMLKPGTVHLDPLQRGIEIDGAQFESSEAGARQLEETLNARYAPTLKVEHERAVEIKDNPASPTGFDIHFVTVRVGARFDVKGHLTQEQLDILQNPAKCNLLQPGIVLRLSPPHLIVRRKRRDGGEERIPEIPDVHYLRATAPQLQQFFNHPMIRKTGGTTVEETLQAAEAHPEEIIEMRVVRHPKDNLVLWLECVTIRGGRFLWRALTHHNVAQLQRSGVFLPDVDATLSLDNRTLSILNSQSNLEETIALDSHSSDEDLSRASRMLAAALKPARPGASGTNALLQADPPQAPTNSSVGFVESPAPAPAAPADDPSEARKAGPSLPTRIVSAASGAGAEAERPKEHSEAPVATSLPPAVETTGTSPPPIEVFPSGRAEARSSETPDEPRLNPIILGLFAQIDPLRVNAEVFRRLADRCGVVVQDLHLSLERVFADRRFEIISFNEREIGSVLDLRSKEFYGFYLSHIGEHRIDFVYACQGAHMEWGADKCALQPCSATETLEFGSSALLGMAQTRDSQFVFVVTPAYKQWVKPHEPRCRETFAHFLTVSELAADPDNYTFIWPERGQSGDENDGSQSDQSMPRS